jgi:hypothetical protein
MKAQNINRCKALRAVASSLSKTSPQNKGGVFVQYIGDNFLSLPGFWRARRSGVKRRLAVLVAGTTFDPGTHRARRGG